MSLLQNMEKQDTKDWINFQKGNQKAFDLIYQRHKDKMYNYCLYISGQKELSEDVVHDVFIKLADQKSKTDKINSIKNWLFIATRNHLFNCLKKITKEVYEPIEQVDPSLSIEQKVFIKKILEKLKPDEREIILLREYHQFSINEISGILEISEEAVRVRLFRVRKKMQIIGKG